MNFDLYNDDCLNVLKTIPSNSVDLIVTDPPYQLDNTKTTLRSTLGRNVQNVNNELEAAKLCQGFDKTILSEMVRVLKKINCYIWCNHKQIPMYLDYFVKQQCCAFDILVWGKTNPPPLFNNKYLTDKEYCLYFRRGGYCNPNSYEQAKTIYIQPTNKKMKKMYNHPTIKPLNIISNVISNSSHEGDVVLDCFMGSGTIGVACKELNRNFIGIEIDSNYYEIAKKRIENT